MEAFLCLNVFPSGSYIFISGIIYSCLQIALYFLCIILEVLQHLVDIVPPASLVKKIKQLSDNKESGNKSNNTDGIDAVHLYQET